MLRDAHYSHNLFEQLDHLDVTSNDLLIRSRERRNKEEERKISLNHNLWQALQQKGLPLNVKWKQ